MGLLGVLFLLPIAKLSLAHAKWTTLDVPLPYGIRCKLFQSHVYGYRLNNPGCLFRTGRETRKKASYM